MFLVFISAFLFASQSSPQIVKGSAQAMSGQLLAFGDLIVELDGVAAPVPLQHCFNSRGKPYGCGRASLLALQGKVEGREVTCQLNGSIRRGRLGRCFVDGEDLGASQVLAGLAVSERSSKAYSDEEEKAKLYQKGLWAGWFINPGDYQIQTDIIRTK